MSEGLNPGANLQQERELELEQAAPPPTLEPETFPWRAEPFDSEFFGIVDREPGETVS